MARSLSCFFVTLHGRQSGHLCLNDSLTFELSLWNDETLQVPSYARALEVSGSNQSRLSDSSADGDNFDDHFKFDVSTWDLT